MGGWRGAGRVVEGDEREEEMCPTFQNELEVLGLLT